MPCQRLVCALVVKLQWLKRETHRCLKSLVAYIAHTTNPLYTATQFALFTSLASVPRTFANATTGYLVEAFGWQVFFNDCFSISVFCRLKDNTT